MTKKEFQRLFGKDNKRILRKKYGNVEARCLSKHLHASKLEAHYCNRLFAQRQHKEIKNYDVQRSFDLFGANGQLICKHVVDFIVFNNNGTFEVHETKGHGTEVWRIKEKLFKACYPDVKYLVVRKGA